MADMDLDAILASALDEFDDEAQATEILPQGAAASAAAAAAAAAAATARADAQALESTKDTITDNVTKLMSEMQNPDFEETLKEALKAMGEAGGDDASFASLFSGAGGNPAAAAQAGAEADASMAQTLQGLAEAAQNMEGMEPAAAEAMGEEMMKKMMADFEQMGDKEDFQTMIEGMMQQLLSKEILHEPIEAICDKFPEWLAENEAKLEASEYERYGKQYQFFQKILAVYETEPDNIERLKELMTDMQELGQPPAEIVKELAPGLQFGEDGTPLLPNMGPGGGALPPGMLPPGMIPPGLDGTENCAIC